MTTTPQITVAGHICLDIIPTWPGTAVGQREQPGRLADLLQPGRLIHVGPAVTATGGAVSNTGLALHRLGVPVQLMGKVGDDLIGRSILDLLARHEPRLAGGMIVVAGEASSYSIVINPPGLDRVFLHCPGANHSFSADDVPYDRLAGQRLFHFGYPPLMRRMFADDGRELAAMLSRVRATGLATSLDMADIDPASPAGQVDWPALLRRTLPHVDLFLPSLDETRFMLDRGRGNASSSPADGPLLHRLAGQLLDWGAAVVGFKLGDQGLYLRTTADENRLSAIGGRAIADPSTWRGRELLAPCFSVTVAGSTGAGDCTIAGFLAALLDGLSPEQAITTAVAVGACSVEQADATSGVIPAPAVQARIRAGWPRQPVTLSLPGWRWDPQAELWIGA
jgi:sugar/nucleoside kinase (ribokinase family)